MNDERTLDLLEAKIQELRELNETDGIDLLSDISRLETKLESMRAELYTSLTDWDRVKIARHPQRPYALDYIERLCSDFYELRGDRLSGDDRALLTGLARFDGQPVVLLAIQKGRTPEESKERNFGMPRPQGYRKARRAMALAERFSLPVISLIDTPGAYPGLESEASNIGGAIAESLLAMTTLGVPTIAAIIGEGGSGGAIAVGAADRVIMMENAIYSVISPEGAAAILWKAKDRTKEAASALGLTAVRLLDLGAIDAVVPEPLGGAHKDFDRAAAALHSALAAELLAVRDVPTEDLLEARYRRYRAAGVFNTLEDASEEPPSDAPGSES